MNKPASPVLLHALAALAVLVLAAAPGGTRAALAQEAATQQPGAEAETMPAPEEPPQPAPQQPAPPTHPREAGGVSAGEADAEAGAAEEAPPRFDPSLFQGLAWRNIGPFRGGRVTAVAGVPQQPFTFYMGATGGGVWKTTDGGETWNNVSDGSFNTGSVGAIAVAPSDPNVVYVGMGEAPVRGVATSHGDGVYRSTDGGETWEHLGLKKTRQISRIQIHPADPETVYVAAQGSPWKPTPERGIYRSRDGGATFEQVLHVDDGAGASDLSLDPTNPRILYAAFWEHRRRPWKITSGGPASGLWKSSDGGNTWQELTKGLPELMGKIGVAASPARPGRVWAMIEAEEGGLFRSDDAGASWKRVNDERVLRARAWYYTHVIADPRDAETVYVLNAPMMRSTDGGKTFTRVRTPHGDNHALWIHPEHGEWMINGNDGGANVSTNGGETWSTQANQPTAQFYRVATDDRFPYRVYGGQQDNSTVAITSRADDGVISREDWTTVGGCESAHIAFDPKDPTLVYAGCYQGLISETDMETGRSRDIMAYPYLGLGADPIDLKYRFNWNAPILASPHDPSVLYHAGNVLLRSEDRGNSWEEVSPDLTKNDPEHLGPGGGPITNEAAGGETYHTIFYVAESPHEAGTLWVGTDDGRVHRTTNGGVAWQEVTPPGLGEAQINAIEVSPHDPAVVYLAVTRYKLGDYTPLVYKTGDSGATWALATAGIPEEAWVRVVREDPVRRGLLYAGTETGVYVSFDDGGSWQGLQLNLPAVPVTDLTVQGRDLVAATQGRAFWILDDLTPLRQLTDEAAAGTHLFQPAPAVRLNEGGLFGGGGGGPGGQNPPTGAVIDYLLPEDLDAEATEVKLEILDRRGEVVRSFSSREEEEPAAPPSPFGGGGEETLPTKAGHNRFVWDLRHEKMAAVPGLFTFGSLGGHLLPPGTFTARLSAGEESLERSFQVVPDPRTDVAPGAYQEQQSMLATLWEMVDELHRAVKTLRGVRDQVDDLLERTQDHAAGEAVKEAGEALVEAIDALEGELVQTKSTNFQDIINYPNQLNAQMLALYGAVDSSGPPVTAGAKERFRDLAAAWSEHQVERDRILGETVPAFNALFAEHAIPAVILPREPAPAGEGEGGEGARQP